jgi:hypothetical protein
MLKRKKIKLETGKSELKLIAREKAATKVVNKRRGYLRER